MKIEALESADQDQIKRNRNKHQPTVPNQVSHHSKFEAPIIDLFVAFETKCLCWPGHTSMERAVDAMAIVKDRDVGIKVTGRFKSFGFW